MRLLEQRGLVEVHVPAPNAHSSIPAMRRGLRSSCAGSGRGGCSPRMRTGMGRSVVVGTLLSAIVSGTEASTLELVRDIARDPGVWEPWRVDAARRLVDLHFGEGDTGGRRPGDMGVG